MSEATPAAPPLRLSEEAAAPQVAGGRTQGVYASSQPDADAEHGSYGSGHAAADVESSPQQLQPGLNFNMMAS